MVIAKSIQNLKSNIFLLLSLLLLGIGLLMCAVFHPTNVRSQPFSIDLDAQKHLVGNIYTPKNIPPPYPVMLLSHGVNSSKEMMTPLAVELALDIHPSLKAWGFQFTQTDLTE